MPAEVIPQEVLDELDDPEYATRSHYSRSTYALGCHGPLCTRAERDRGRRRNAVAAANAGRDYKPNHKIRAEEDDIDRAVSWYLSERERTTLSA